MSAFHPCNQSIKSAPNLAAALQDDLRRPRIEPFAWIINQRLLQSGSCDPLLQRREDSEHGYRRKVVEMHAKRKTCLPWQPEEPVGPEALARFAFAKLEVFKLSEGC